MFLLEKKREQKSIFSSIEPMIVSICVKSNFAIKNLRSIEKKQKLLKEKKGSFKRSQEHEKLFFLTLITPFGAKENSHSLGVIDQQLTLDALY